MLWISKTQATSQGKCKSHFRFPPLRKGWCCIIFPKRRHWWLGSRLVVKPQLVGCRRAIAWGERGYIGGCWPIVPKERVWYNGDTSNMFDVGEAVPGASCVAIKRPLGAKTRGVTGFGCRNCLGSQAWILDFLCIYHVPFCGGCDIDSANIRHRQNVLEFMYSLVGCNRIANN